MPHATRAVAFMLVIFSLGACNGDGDDDLLGPPVEPQRGELLESPPVKLASYEPADLFDLLETNELGRELLRLILEPRCSVDVHQLRYQTVDPAGALTPASGALMIPNGADSACQNARPIVLYAHGTNTDSSFNIADLQNPDSGEGLLLAMVFAAQGYIVVAPNYLGYDSSTLDYHPFLNGDQQSKDMIDALAAARSALPTSSAPSATDSGQLFVTGYSQGGYVAMATHRAMETAGLTVTASAPMSGPYALSAFGDAIFEGQVIANAPVYLTLLLSSYQNAYGDIYANATDAFEAQYASGIESLLPSTTPLSELRSQGRLPADELFSDIPPDSAFASMTPATTPANLASVFARGFGPNNLLTNSFRLAYLEDALAHPDGGFPAITDGLPPADPASPLRQALQANDLRNWTPTAPLFLCGGNSDPTVFFFNTELMLNYWATTAPTAPMAVLDIDSPSTSDDPFADLKSVFQAAKDAVRIDAVLNGADDDGDSAVLDAYHVPLVAPFCLSAVKSFFDAIE